MSISLKRIKTKRTLTNISLFSGAMGLDLGLDFAGFDTRVCVEIDKFCQNTIKNNYHKLGKYCLPTLSDVTALSSTDILAVAGLTKNQVTLMAGGPPCQAFSTAGKRGSLNDPRGGLVGKYLELVDDIRPRFFVFENVRGILSAALKHRPLNERGTEFPSLSPEEQLGSVLKLFILPTFKQIGYEVLYGLVDAADYGVPQNRHRVIFIGSRDYEFSKLGFETLEQVIPPTHSKNGTGNKEKWVTLGQALSSLKEEESKQEFSSYSEARANILSKVPMGKNWRYLRDNYGEEYLKEVMGGAYTSSGGKVGFWRRLSLEKPSPTLTTSPLQKSTALCHPTKTRPLSVSEYAKIQDFPKWWEFAGSTTQKYKQIGNAVPVGLARAVGNGIIKVIIMADKINLEINTAVL